MLLSFLLFNILTNKKNECQKIFKLFLIKLSFNIFFKFHKFLIILLL
jgi:hypothetical protein